MVAYVDRIHAWTAAGTQAAIAGSTTVTFGAAPANGDRMFLYVSGKPDTTGIPTINQGWTLLVSGTGGSGATGGDVGVTYFALYGKDKTDNTVETAPTLTFGGTATNVSIWTTTIYRPGEGYHWVDSIGASPSWVLTASDTTTASSPLTATFGAFANNPTTGDALVAYGTTPTDSTIQSTSTITVTGLSGGTVEQNTGRTTTGNDMTDVKADWINFTGTGSSAATVTFNFSAGSNTGGPLVLIHLRQAPGTVVTGGQAQETDLLRPGMTNPTAYDDAVLALPDLAGYWPLDEESGTQATDHGPLGAHGTYVGSPALNTTPGPLGDKPSMAVLSNAPYVTLPTSELGLGTPVTIFGWVIPNLGGAIGQHVFRDATGAGGTGWVFNIPTSGGVPARINGTDTTAAWYAEDRLNTNARRFGVLTSDGTTVRAYYDGELWGEYAISAAASTIANPIHIGKNGTVAGQFVWGHYAGYGIVNRALEQHEVTELYKAGRRPQVDRIRRATGTSGSATPLSGLTQVTGTMPGDRIFYICAVKPDTAVTSPSANNGYTLIKTGTGGTGGAAADTGPVKYHVFAKTATIRDEPAPTITWTTNPSVIAVLPLAFRPEKGYTWADSIGSNVPWITDGSDTNTASPLTATVGALANNPTEGDSLAVFGVIPTDSGTAVPSTPLTVTGLTIPPDSRGTVLSSGTGNDIGIPETYYGVVLGTASAAPVPSIAITSATNHSGVVAVMHLRQTPLTDFQASPVPESDEALPGTVTVNSSQGTRFYLASTGTPAVVPSTYATVWNDTAGVTVRPLVPNYPSNTALAILSRAQAVTTGDYDVLIGAFVSPPLEAQTISGSFNLNIGVGESATTLNAYHQVTIRLIDNTGAERSVLYSGTPFTNSAASGNAFEWPVTTTAPSTRRFFDAMTSQTAVAGDRLVIEIGYRSDSTSAASTTGYLRVGDPTAGSDLAYADGGVTSADRTWISFQSVIFVEGRASLELSGTGVQSSVATASLSLSATGRAATPMVDAILADSPRAYYRLGEPSGTTMIDSSGNGRDGTYQGTITQGVTGLLVGDADTAVTFGGSNNAMGQVTNASWQQLPGGFSVASRIKPAFPGTPYQAIASMYDSSFTNSQFVFRIEGGHLALYIFRGNGFFAASGGTTLTAGTNYTAHATWDGTTAKVYLNGVLDGSTTNAGAANTSTVNFTIGNRNPSGGGGDVDSKFGGTIDEVAYFAGDIGATRVAAHHAAATNVLTGTGSIALSASVAATASAPSGTATLGLTATGTDAAAVSASASLSLSGEGSWATYGTATLSLSGDASASAATSATASLDLAGAGVVSSPASATASLDLSGFANVSVEEQETEGTASLSLSGEAVHSSLASASLDLSATGSGQTSGVASAALDLSATGNPSVPRSGTAAVSLSGTGAATPASARSGTALLSFSATGVSPAYRTATGLLSFSATGGAGVGRSGTASISLFRSTGGVGVGKVGSASITLSGVGVFASRSGTAQLSLVMPPITIVAAIVITQGVGQVTLVDEVMIFPSELRLTLLETVVERAPTSLTVVLSGAEAQTDITFDIDGTDVLTISADSNGELGPTTINLNTTLGTAGSHTLTATQITVGGTITDSETFTVSLAPATYPTPPVVHAPSTPVPEAVVDNTRHWVLQDLLPTIDGGIGSYVFPHNPVSMTSPHYEHALTSRHSTASDGKIHVFQAATTPKEWTFTGYCPTQEHQVAILAYRHLNRRFYLIDHRNRAWTVVFTDAQFIPRLRHNYNGVDTDWGSDFTITAVVLDQDFTVPA